MDTKQSHNFAKALHPSPHTPTLCPSLKCSFLPGKRLLNTLSQHIVHSQHYALLPCLSSLPFPWSPGALPQFPSSL